MPVRGTQDTRTFSRGAPDPYNLYPKSTEAYTPFERYPRQVATEPIRSPVDPLRDYRGLDYMNTDYRPTLPPDYRTQTYKPRDPRQYPPQAYQISSRELRSEHQPPRGSYISESSSFRATPFRADPRHDHRYDPRHDPRHDPRNYTRQGYPYRY